MQTHSNFRSNQTDLHEVLSRLTLLSPFLFFLINNRIAGLAPKKTDLPEMFQEQVDWYQVKTNPYETIISFCIVNSKHCQTCEMKIFAKIKKPACFRKGYMYYKVLNTTLLWKFVIFVIKPSTICANNNLKLKKTSSKSLR